MNKMKLRLKFPFIGMTRDYKSWINPVHGWEMTFPTIFHYSRANEEYPYVILIQILGFGFTVEWGHPRNDWYEDF